MSVLGASETASARTGKMATSDNCDAHKEDLTLALSKLQVLQQGDGDDTSTSPSMSTMLTAVTASSERSRSARSSQSPPSDSVATDSARMSIAEDEQSSHAATASSHSSSARSSVLPALDVALIDALRDPRDRVFVTQYEREISSKIKQARNDGQNTSWCLPLMNTYQRMLIHRIADQYGLSHAVDPATMQVTLTTRDDSRIPIEDLTTRAGRERLCEKAATLPFEEASGTASNVATPDNDAATPLQPAAPLGFRIMRRSEGRGRQAVAQGDDSTDDGSKSGRKDRRELTMEERAASYREARQRIFGADDRASTSSGAVTPGSTSSIAQSSVSKEPDSGRVSPSTASHGSSRPSLSPNISASTLFTPPYLKHAACSSLTPQQAAYHQPQHRHSVPHLAQPHQQHALAWQGQGALHPMNTARPFVPMQPYGLGTYTPPYMPEVGYPMYHAIQPTTEMMPFSMAYAAQGASVPYGIPAGMYGTPSLSQSSLYPSAAPFVPSGGLDAAASTASAGRSRRFPGDRTLFDPSKPLSSQHSNASRSPSSTSMMTATSSAPPLSRRTSNASAVSTSHSGVAADGPNSTATSSAPVRRSQGSASPNIDRSSSSSPAALLKASLPPIPVTHISPSANSTPSLSRPPPASLPARPDWVMAARRGQAAAATESLPVPSPGTLPPQPSAPIPPASGEEPS